MNRHIHQITQGALLCALEGVLLVINRQLAGVLDSYLIWVIPLPLIVYSSKYGLKDSLWVALSLVLLSFIIATPVTIFYVAGSALIGCVYGYGLGKGKSNAWLLICAILGSLVMTYFTCVIFAGFFGYDINLDIQEIQLMAQAFKVSLPVDWNLKLLIYGVLFLTCLLEGFLIHLLAYFVLRKLKINFPQFVPLTQWKLPKWVAGSAVGLLVLYLISPYFTGLSQYSEILLLVAMPGFLALCLFGYLCIVIYLKHRGLKYAIIVVVVLLFVFPTYMFLALAIIGALDSFINLRLKILEDK